MERRLADDPRLLLFVPTYNERENAPEMVRQLAGLGLGADLLFMDDGSPDGTGEILDRLAERADLRLRVIHRSGKLGIGSAHQDGIAWAYDHGYDTLVTLDCDFTHSPADVSRLLDRLAMCDLAVGSRYLAAGSLPGWNLMRRTLTRVGHLLTRRVLGIRHDATGAFRAYRLGRVPRGAFALVRSRGYAFFFESMFVFDRNGLSIGEIPIVLPSRTYGHSKMSIGEVARSVRRVFDLFVAVRLHPARYRLPPPPVEVDASLLDPQGWDAYWQRDPRSLVRAGYGAAAWLYRNLINRRELNRYVRHHFAPGSRLLHAGCGSGQVDVDLQREMRLTGLDISGVALARYRLQNPRAEAVRHGSILALPFPPASFDGVYNMGVVEHFTRDQIVAALRQFHRALVPGGKVLIFWPHQHASSVRILNGVQQLLRRVGRSPAGLHPPEVSLLASRDQARAVLDDAGFDLIGFAEPTLILVQAVVVGRRRGAEGEAQATAPAGQRPVVRQPSTGAPCDSRT